VSETFDAYVLEGQGPAVLRSPHCPAGDEVIVPGWGRSKTWPSGYTRRQGQARDRVVIGTGR
jgi:hypothetical protein